jgi:crotonobetainyl-CoA:carnitine CoA-transferase CaiB-like acyl-CoA transferase
MGGVGVAPNCLEGARVVDLLQFEAGLSCGEPGRVLGSGPQPGADAYYFLIYNATKKSVTIDLKTDRGPFLVKEMAKRADVFVERGIIQTMRHPRGDLRIRTFPVRFDGAAPPVEPAPLLGEHTGQVLSDWLGISADEIRSLHSDGVA